MLKAFYSFGESKNNFVIDSLYLYSKFEYFFNKVAVDFVYIASYVINQWTSIELPNFSET